MYLNECLAGENSLETVKCNISPDIFLSLFSYFYLQETEYVNIRNTHISSYIRAVSTFFKTLELLAYFFVAVDPIGNANAENAKNLIRSSDRVTFLNVCEKWIKLDWRNNNDNVFTKIVESFVSEIWVVILQGFDKCFTKMI